VISYASHPIQALCIRERAISPLQVGDDVEILRRAPQRECACDIFVMIRWSRAGGKPELGVPLSQLEVTLADENVRQAVEDWHYWVDRGYDF
jgi:hypothetical protein